jgi:molybdopterin synthase catalytic subunit
MFSISATTIDAETLKQNMTDRRAGALVTFEGWVRDHNEGQKVLTLEYEAYEALCATEAKQILQEAKEKFAVIDVRCVHRTGTLEIGEMAVWVGVSSAHRGAAFDACRFVIDEIKERLPIWKKETYVNGSSGWVNCQAHCGQSKESSHKEAVPAPFKR